MDSHLPMIEQDGTMLSSSKITENNRHGGVHPVLEAQVNQPVIKSCMSSGSLKGLGERRVSFTKIEIREYERAIGDNVTSRGVPLSLGWEYDSSAELDLEEYEKHRPEPRTHKEMQIPTQERMDLLRAAGYSLQDRMEATKRSNIERNRRRSTAAKTPEIDRAEYALERASRGLMKILNRKIAKSKSKEKQEIEDLIRWDRIKADQREQSRRRHSCPCGPIQDLDAASEITPTPQQLGRPETTHEPDWLLGQAPGTETCSQANESGSDWYIGEDSQ